jgi:hypothetical protein
MAWREDAHFTKLRLGKNNHVVSNRPYGATFVIGAEAANAINVGIQLLNASGQELDQRCAVAAYLSSDVNGDVVEAVSATLTITGGTDGVTMPFGAANVLGHHNLLLLSEADGDIDVVVTQTSGVDTHYLVLVMADGSIVVSTAITFA